MNESPGAPKNATDRNVQTAVGLFKGHITLPSAFLTTSMLVICGSFLLVTHWCFDEVSSIRERLREHEKIIYGFIEKVSATPAQDPARDSAK